MSRDRVCDWCKGPIPAHARRDSVCCSKRCRQARHRFRQSVGHAGSAGAGRSLALAYADPPYPGKAGIYRGHADFGGEVDHRELIARLLAFDGWALSTSAEALPVVLALCPPGVRVAAWHRGPRVVRSRYPLNAWEPVIYFGGRQLAGRVRSDSVTCGPKPATTDPARVVGAKPAAVCRWISELLGVLPGDTLADLFPGSGAVSRAWLTYTAEASRLRPAGTQASRYPPARRTGSVE